MIFSGLICPKTTIKKKLNFLKKVWTNPFAKNSMFWIFIKVVFFWSLWKISIFWNFLKVLFTAQKSFFCIWNIQKRSFLAWFTHWNTHEKKFNFLTKSMDFNFFDFFKSSLFWSKNKSFPLKISRNDLFRLDVPKNTFEKKFDFLTKSMD